MDKKPEPDFVEVIEKVVESKCEIQEHHDIVDICENCDDDCSACYLY